jgi:hypothetical protein
MVFGTIEGIPYMTNVKIDDRAYKRKLRRIAKDRPSIARKIIKNVGKKVYGLSGRKYINNKTGKLASKFYTDAFSPLEGFLINKAPYAGVQEFGGTIRAKKGGVLHFNYNGAEVFARRVKIQPSKFFISAIEELMHNKGFSEAIAETLQQEYDKR